MKAILDTNTFYYISGISYMKNSSKIFHLLKTEFDDFLVSDLSILELLVKYRNQREIIIKGINFLSSNNVKGHKFLPETDSFIKYLNSNIMSSNNDFDKLVDTAFSLKIKIESEFLLFWFGYTISSMIALLYDKNDFNIEKINLLQKQLEALVLSIKDSNGYVYDELTKFLMDFYNTGDQAALKQQINYMVLNVLFIAMSMLESSSEGKIIFLEDASKLESYLSKLDNKSNKHIKIVDKKLLPKLNDILNQLVEKLKPLIGFPLAQYYAVLVKKFLSLDNKLFNKNDIWMDYFLNISKNIS
jgi:hypothetical protein